MKWNEFEDNSGYVEPELCHKCNTDMPFCDCVRGTKQERDLYFSKICVDYPELIQKEVDERYSDFLQTAKRFKIDRFREKPSSLNNME